MIVANSVIITAIGLAFTSEKSLPPILSQLLPVLGFVVLAAWFVLMKRGFDYHLYYLLSARELEESLLSDTVRTVSRGGLFAEGCPVTFQINGQPRTIKMSFWGQLARASLSSYIVIGLFAIVYLVALLKI